MTDTKAAFACDDSGYVRHWLVAGPRATPYDGPPGDEGFMRRHVADASTAVPSVGGIALGQPAPNGEPWRYRPPGENIFVERSAFHTHLARLDMFAATDLVSSNDTEVDAAFWACGTADLWAGGRHVARQDVPRYMYPQSMNVRLALAKGPNRLLVRLQALGVRDTRFLFGLQVLGRPAGLDLDVRLPVADSIMNDLASAERWLRGVRASGRLSACVRKHAQAGDRLVARGPAPFAATLKVRGEMLAWPAGTGELAFDHEGAASLSLALEVAGQELGRTFEIPANRRIRVSSAASLEEHRRGHMRDIASGEAGGRGGAMKVLARRFMKPAGERDERDSETIADACRAVDARGDCADFILAALLRLHALGLLSGNERAQVKETSLAFRYWPDEPGSDAMCFGSENHALLFHGCELVAGRLFADGRFTNSGRSGPEVAAAGLSRAEAWLAGVEAVGFREFLSSSYMPLTAAALMNLVDFSGDEGVSRRAAALVDRVFELVALHAFDGVTTGPQGRVYRNVLYPDSSGTQALLSYADRDAVLAHSDWLTFVATSPGYAPPDGLARLMRDPVSATYRQCEVEIVLEKTRDYALSSLGIPASFPAERAGAPNACAGLFPGDAGYQQHVWHATLGRECHVFVNHPGATDDPSSARPGYWYGNGVLPRVLQRGGRLAQVFVIPDEHPVRFTHAHWPADTFDREEVRGRWAFGAKGAGRIALWASEPLEPHDEILTGRELRARGTPVAWVCLCSGEREAGDFDSFVRKCLEAEPSFDAGALALRLGDGEVVRYSM